MMIKLITFLKYLKNSLLVWNNEYSNLSKILLKMDEWEVNDESSYISGWFWNTN
jgi:hypothetical protein